MKLLGQTKITTIEEPDRLRFILTTEHGWLDLFASPVVLTVVAAYSFHSKNWWVLVFCAVGFVYLTAHYRNGPVTSIFVSDWGIEASGNLGRPFTRYVRIQADSIETFGYDSGGENEDSGLYVNRNELLATLTEEQANEISNAVCRRFPLLEKGDRSGTSLLHAEDSRITTLGL